MYHLATYPSTPHPKQQTTPKLKDALHQVRGDVTTIKQELPTLSKRSHLMFFCRSLLEIRKISETLPSALQDE